MKKFSSLLSILIILGVIYWSFYDLKPSLPEEDNTSETEFSLNNALNHIKIISEK